MSKKKVLSVVLTAAMVASLATVSAVTTSAADTRGKIYFDSTGLGGKAGAQRGTYYCYVWNNEDGDLYSWGSKELKMKNEDGENLYSFDIPKANANGKEIDTNLVIFNALGGEQTYDTTFNDACIGDTAYVIDGVLFENPVDSTKTAKGCAWKKNTTQGPHIAITSTGKVQGYGILEGETAENITTDFQEKYKAGMDEGKTGYDNPDLLTEEAYNKFVAEIQAILDNPPVPPAPEDPTDAPVTEDPTDAPVVEAPTDAPVVEDPTDANVVDPYGRIPGLPLPSDMNVPAKDTNRDVYSESKEFPSDWDGYFNVYYFEVPEEWLTEHKEAKDFEVGFYWYRGGLSNAAWPGVEASKLSVLDENGNDIYADKNIYYGFAPSFATCIIWNNGISDKVEENKKFKLQTDDIKVDDPMSNSIADTLYEADDSIEGAYITGCLGYVAESYTKTNELTGDLQTVYKVEWKYFNPRTGETTFDPLKDSEGNVVTVADDYWEYSKVAVNPYFDLDYDHVNEAEIPTEPAPSTLPPAPTQSATDATGATNATTNNTNTGKGTVDTDGGSIAVTLATVLLAAMGVTVLARKRRESTNA